MVVVLDRSTTGEIGEHLGHRLQRGLGILDRERRGRWMYYTVRPERLERLQDALRRFIDAGVGA
jgi:DNA-binding transcriptional ArsR family regulator